MNQKDNLVSLETISSCLMSSYCLCAHVRLFGSPWTVACQAPLSMGCPRQAYWSGLPFPHPGIFPTHGIKLVFPASLSLAGGFFATEPPEKPLRNSRRKLKISFLPAESFSFGGECVLIPGRKDIPRCLKSKLVKYSDWIECECFSINDNVVFTMWDVFMSLLPDFFALILRSSWGHWTKPNKQNPSWKAWKPFKVFINTERTVFWSNALYSQTHVLILIDN